MTDTAEPLDFLHRMPPPAAPRWVETVPGRRLAWNEFGDPAGFPVMYYHGWPSCRLQAVLAHSLAAERGLRLIAMDRPGMGESTYQPGRTLAGWADEMTAFADALGIARFGQLAVSGGGPYALACAARIPHRIAGSAVLAGAVPLAGLADGHRGLHPVYRALIRLRYLPPHWFSPVFAAAGWATRLSPQRPPLSWLMATLGPADRQLLAASPEIWPVVTRSFREGIRREGGRGVMADAAIYFQPPGFDPTQVRQVIRYWHGGDDRNIPVERVRAFTDLIPGARLEVMETLGHFSLVLRKAAAALDHLAIRGREVGGLTPADTGET